MSMPPCGFAHLASHSFGLAAAHVETVDAERPPDARRRLSVVRQRQSDDAHVDGAGGLGGDLAHRDTHGGDKKPPQRQPHPRP